jgi:hypothetical protein
VGEVQPTILKMNVIFSDKKWFLVESLKIFLQNQNYNMIANYPSSVP